jgi:hypothetical protein
VRLSVYYLCVQPSLIAYEIPRENGKNKGEGYKITAVRPRAYTQLITVKVGIAGPPRVGYIPSCSGETRREFSAKTCGTGTIAGCGGLIRRSQSQKEM